MSEHRRKQPQPGGGGRAAARRGAPGGSGRRAAPRGGSTASPSDSYGSPSGSYGTGPGSTGSSSYDDERPYGGRAEARRAAQRSGGHRRGGAEGPGRGSGHRGGGRGRGGPPGGPGGGRSGPPPKKRFIDYPRAGKYGWKRWVPSWRLVTGSFFGFVGALLVAGGIGYAMVGVPDPQKAATAQNNVYYWANGDTMVSTGGEFNRQNVKYEDMPESMRDAVISAENKTFWSDSGIDPQGIARAMVNMAKGGETQGGSTITQQYVKNALLGDQSQTISRKVKELFVTIKVGLKEPKRDIITNYLNTAYFGRGAYGVEAASRAYYNKPVNKLTRSQTAFLASLLKGATYYDPAGNENLAGDAASPAANTKRATARWKWILDQEVKYHPNLAAERKKYTTFPMPDPPRSNGQLKGQIGYLVSLAKGYVINNTGITEQQLNAGGYEIHTTFQKNKVDELEKAVKNVREKNIDPKKRPKTDKYVQFGGASVNPHSGAIEAIYGGEDATKHFTDNADQTGAQVGSTFKPFVLAAAMRDGVQDKSASCGLPSEPVPDPRRTIINPDSTYSGQNKLKIKCPDGTAWTDKDGNEWLQTNDGGESDGSKPDYKITLREAMRESVNSAYVQLGMDVGLDRVKQSALDAGLKESSFASSNFPSFSIGTSDPSAIRMAGAYSTFAADGQQREPYSVSKVTNKDGVAYEHKDEVKSPFSPEVAHNVTSVLKTVVDKGTGTNAKLAGRQVAGKTGTTDGNKSAWFVGYTPQLSTAISMYRLDDNAKSTDRKFLEMYGTGGQEKIHGASFPSEIFHDYMTEALKGTTPEAFPPPEHIGKAIGASPSPSISPSPSDSTSVSPSPSNSAPTSPSPSDSCGPFQPCTDGGNLNGGDINGGNGNGGTTGGTTDGGTTDGGTTGETTGGTTGTNGGGTRGNTGGFLGGPTG